MSDPSSVSVEAAPALHHLLVQDSSPSQVESVVAALLQQGNEESQDEEGDESFLSALSTLCVGPDGPPLLASALSASVGSSVCAAPFRHGEPAYTCSYCGVDPTCVQCVSCFREADHSGHADKVRMISAGGGGCCDCGDEHSWKNVGACKRHQRKEQQQAAKPIDQVYSQQTIVVMRAVLAALMRIISAAMEARKTWENAPTILLPRTSLRLSGCERSARHVVVLLNDEVHSFDQVIGQLTAAAGTDASEGSAIASLVHGRGRAPFLVGDRVTASTAKSRMDEIELGVEIHRLPAQTIYLTHQRVKCVLEWARMVCNAYLEVRDWCCEALKQPCKLLTEAQQTEHASQTQSGQQPDADQPMSSSPLLSSSSPSSPPPSSTLQGQPTRAHLHGADGSVMMEDSPSPPTPTMADEEEEDEDEDESDEGKDEDDEESDDSAVSSDDDDELDPSRFAALLSAPLNDELSIHNGDSSSEEDDSSPPSPPSFSPSPPSRQAPNRRRQQRQEQRRMQREERRQATTERGEERERSEPESEPEPEAVAAAGGTSVGPNLHAAAPASGDAGSPTPEARPCIDLLIRDCHYLPQSIFSALTNLCFTLFTNHEFKLFFAERLTRLLPQLLHSFVRFNGDLDHSALDLTVQVYTVPTLVRPLVMGPTQLFKGLNALLRHYLVVYRRDRSVNYIDVRGLASGDSPYPLLLHQLRYIMRCQSVMQELLRVKPAETVRTWMDMLKLLEGMDPNKRERIVHVSHESTTWPHAFTLAIRTNAVTALLLRSLRQMLTAERERIRTTAAAITSSSSSSSTPTTTPPPSMHFILSELRSVCESGMRWLLRQEKKSLRVDHRSIPARSVECVPLLYADVDLSSFHHPLARFISEIIHIVIRECGNHVHTSNNNDEKTEEEAEAGEARLEWNPMDRLKIVDVSASPPVTLRAPVPLYLTLLDHAARSLSLLAHVRSRLWVLNGTAITDQAWNYARAEVAGLQLRTDILTLQQSVAFMNDAQLKDEQGRAVVSFDSSWCWMNVLLRRFCLDPYLLAPSAYPNRDVPGTTRMFVHSLRYQGKLYSVVEEFLFWSLVVLVDRSRIGASSAMERARDRIVQRLMVGPATWSQIQKAVKRKYNIGEEEDEDDEDEDEEEEEEDEDHQDDGKEERVEAMDGLRSSTGDGSQPSPSSHSLSRAALKRLLNSMATYSTSSSSSAATSARYTIRPEYITLWNHYDSNLSAEERQKAEANWNVIREEHNAKVEAAQRQGKQSHHQQGAHIPAMYPPRLHFAPFVSPTLTPLRLTLLHPHFVSMLFYLLNRYVLPRPVSGRQEVELSESDRHPIDGHIPPPAAGAERSTHERILMHALYMITLAAEEARTITMTAAVAGASSIIRSSSSSPSSNHSPSLSHVHAFLSAVGTVRGRKLTKEGASHDTMNEDEKSESCNLFTLLCRLLQGSVSSTRQSSSSSPSSSASHAAADSTRSPQRNNQRAEATMSPSPSTPTPTHTTAIWSQWPLQLQQPLLRHAIQRLIEVEKMVQEITERGRTDMGTEAQSPTSLKLRAIADEYAIHALLFPTAAPTPTSSHAAAASSTSDAASPGSTSRSARLSRALRVRRRIVRDMKQRITAFAEKSQIEVTLGGHLRADIKKPKKGETQRQETDPKEHLATALEDEPSSCLTCIVCHTSGGEIGLIGFAHPTHLAGLPLQAPPSQPFTPRQRIIRINKRADGDADDDDSKHESDDISMPISHRPLPMQISTTAYAMDARDKMMPIGCRSCSHALHFSCLSSYVASLWQRAAAGMQWEGMQSVRLEAGEFCCPACKQISNILIPIHPHEDAHAHAHAHTHHEKRNQSEQSGESASAMRNPSQGANGPVAMDGVGEQNDVPVSLTHAMVQHPPAGSDAAGSRTIDWLSKSAPFVSSLSLPHPSPSPSSSSTAWSLYRSHCLSLSSRFSDILDRHRPSTHPYTRLRDLFSSLYGTIRSLDLEYRPTPIMQASSSHKKAKEKVKYKPIYASATTSDLQLIRALLDATHACAMEQKDEGQEYTVSAWTALITLLTQNTHQEVMQTDNGTKGESQTHSTSTATAAGTLSTSGALMSALSEGATSSSLPSSASLSSPLSSPSSASSSSPSASSSPATALDRLRGLLGALASGDSLPQGIWRRGGAMGGSQSNGAAAATQGGHADMQPLPTSIEAEDATCMPRITPISCMFEDPFELMLRCVISLPIHSQMKGEDADASAGAEASSTSSLSTAPLHHALTLLWHLCLFQSVLHIACAPGSDEQHRYAEQQWQLQTTSMGKEEQQRRDSTPHLQPLLAAVQHACSPHDRKHAHGQSQMTDSMQDLGQPASSQVSESFSSSSSSSSSVSVYKCCTSALPSFVLLVLPFLRCCFVLFSALGLVSSSSAARQQHSTADKNKSAAGSNSMEMDVSMSDEETGDPMMDEYHALCHMLALPSIELIGKRMQMQIQMLGTQEIADTSRVTEPFFDAMIHTYMRHYLPALEAAHRSLPPLSASLPLPLPLLHAFVCPSFISLPPRYDSLFQSLSTSEGLCSTCDERPSDPALCLTCGRLLCAGASCCTRAGRGELTSHTATCSPCNGMYILLRQSSVMCVVNGMAQCVGSFYADRDDELDLTLARGRTLFLSNHRLHAIHHIWKTIGAASSNVSRARNGRYLHEIVRRNFY